MERAVLFEAEVVSYYSVETDKLTNCTKAAICDGRFEEQANATVALIAHRRTPDPTEPSLGSCTGTLVSSPDRKKTYVLTATHCYANRTDIGQFQNWIAVFNWNPDSCTVPPAVPTFKNVTQAVRGMRLAFHDPASDVLLLELTTNIPSNWGVRSAGIQVSNVAPLDVVSIHHGAGSWKKISYANTSYLEGGPAVGPVPEAVILGSKAGLIARPKDHWRVVWTDGVTQGGSSGASMFDAETGKVVAVLSGGNSACNSEDKTDYYGRLASAWGRGLANYLGEGAGTVPPEGDLIYSSEAYEDVSAEGGVGTDVSAFILDPETPDQVIQVFLVDPPEDATEIIVDVNFTSLLGADADAFIVQPTRLVFDSMDVQNITVSFAGGAAAAGEVSVFELTLTAKDENGQPLPARDSARVKGVATASLTPDDVPETVIPELPYNATAPIDNAAGKAVFAYNTTEDASVDVKLCTVEGLQQDTALVVVQGEEIYAVVADGGAFEDDCVAMSDIQLAAGQQYYFFLSDADLLQFLVPMSLVRSFEVTPTEGLAAHPEPLSLLLDRPGPGVSAFPANIGAAERKRKAMGGPLALWDAAFSRIRENQRLHLAWCCAGVIGCLVAYGVLQEKIMQGSFDGERFTFSLFLVLCNRLTTMSLAVIMLVLYGQDMRPVAPPYNYAAVSVSNVVATFCQYEALKHVSFPMQTLGKCAKMIPVMIWGTIIMRKRYGPKDYLNAALITLGCTLFLMTGSVKSRHASSDSSVFGLMLMLGYLGFDGFTSTFQDKLFKGYQMTIYNQILYVTSFSATFSLLGLVSAGQLMPAISFISRHPDALASILTLSAAATVGQLFISHTIKTFGALLFATVMTTRQFISILLSCILFAHPLTGGQWLGTVMVFGALYYKSFSKGGSSHKGGSTPKAPAAEGGDPSEKLPLVHADATATAQVGIGAEQK
ncbi:hypothetical protein COHA_000958 [Chlorella ohadii]|uniref:Uncharacterized protein n=1 Tax=Chlorella ohadii TaxID=2649997 RepID=A0AAD5E058_9CHLO|nr:hypothetical protein COHA_000958 [Chlorella ohadii]